MDLQKSVFEFVSYTADLANNQIQFNYSVNVLDQKHDFTETIILPESVDSNVPQELLDSILHALHIMLGVSYWKAFCSSEIVVKTKTLTKEQAVFWNTVYTKGLGEFFYKNQIDFRGLIQFPYEESSYLTPVSFPRTNRSLVGIGGGKDSILTAELLKKAQKKVTNLIIDTQRIHGISAQVSFLTGNKTINIKRNVDPQLFELNKVTGIFNGHIPVSAVYAFIGTLVGILYDYKYVIVSNEKSASYGNTEYLGETINHQWSKSLEFEKIFQGYIKTFVTSDVIYFSLLRELSEFQITELFSKHPAYFQYFSSCNRNYELQHEHQRPVWCGECPKCAFVFVMLAASLSKEKVLEIFGQNLLGKESLIPVYKELLGVSGIKPFECVGTPEEVTLAFYKVHEKSEYAEDSIMKMFESVVLPSISDIKPIENEVYKKGEDVIPEEFKHIL